MARNNNHYKISRGCPNHNSFLQNSYTIDQPIQVKMSEFQNLWFLIVGLLKEDRNFRFLDGGRLAYKHIVGCKDTKQSRMEFLVFSIIKSTLKFVTLLGLSCAFTSLQRKTLG